MFKQIISALVATGLAGCSVVPPTYLVAPGDPSAPAQPPKLSSVTSGAQSWAVTSPLSWDELNRRVGPKQEGAHAQ